jgi:hypothetical protein
MIITILNISFEFSFVIILFIIIIVSVLRWLVKLERLPIVYLPLLLLMELTCAILIGFICFRIVLLLCLDRFCAAAPLLIVFNLV